MTDASLYFFKAVQWASEQGLVEGETFDPYAGCTRAMAVYFMWVAADSPEAAAASFTDVAADADYAAAVNWAVAQGVTLGTGDGSTFSPDTVCQRGQIVTFLYRAAGSPAVTEGGSFADVEDGAWYADAVAWAAAQGITAGVSADAFGPNASCTRAQIVTFLYRARSM